MSSDDKFILLTVSDNYVISWSFETKEKKIIIPSKVGAKIGFLSISSNNSIFCVVEENIRINVYDLAGKEINAPGKVVNASEKEEDLTVEPKKKFLIEESKINCIALSNIYVFIGNTSSEIMVWNHQTSQSDSSIENKHSSPMSLFLYENHKYLAIGYANQDLVVWNVQNKFREVKLTIEHGFINAISYSCFDNRQTLVCTTDEKKVDLVKKNIKRHFTRHAEKIRSVVQTIYGKLVITASADKLIKIWQQGELRDYKSLNRSSTSIKASSLHKPSDLFAITYEGQRVKLFNLAKDKEVYSLSWKGQSVYAALWNHDSKHLITANSTPKIYCIHPKTKV